MTQKEFKDSMVRGLGRCVIAAKQNPERYRKSILMACRKNPAYDPQCEGSRAWYTYTLAACFADRRPFIDAAVGALKKHHPSSNWDLSYLGELLMHFALDGDSYARAALEDKYRELLARIFSRKRRPRQFFWELSELEELGMILSNDRASVLRIAEDFGRLYQQKGFLEDGEFFHFFALEGKTYRKQLESAAKRNEHIACFLQREQAYIAALERRQKMRKEPLPGELTGIRLSIYLKKTADRETVAQYALAYREEKRLKYRAEALYAFAECPYPDDPQPIIEDAQSDCEELRDRAWRALENLRHPDVRTFALNNIANKERTVETFLLLVSNYLPEDAPLLEKLLRERIAERDWDGVHSAGLAVDAAFSKGGKCPRPKQLLPLLYRYTPCSCCREYFLRHMAKHRMLTKEMLEECRYDSRDAIRKFAATAAARRNAPLQFSRNPIIIK